MLNRQKNLTFGPTLASPTGDHSARWRIVAAPGGHVRFSTTYSAAGTPNGLNINGTGFCTAPCQRDPLGSASGGAVLNVTSASATVVSTNLPILSDGTYALSLTGGGGRSSMTCRSVPRSRLEQPVLPALKAQQVRPVPKVRRAPLARPAQLALRVPQARRVQPVPLEQRVRTVPRVQRRDRFQRRYGCDRRCRCHRGLRARLAQRALQVPSVPPARKVWRARPVPKV
jgi:hypothetical protein